LPTAEELLRVPAGERVGTLVERLSSSVRTALGSRAATVDPDAPLSGLGLDSLMAVELRNEVQSRLGIKVTVADFLKGATVRGLAEQVAGELAGRPAGQGTAGGGEVPTIRRVARAGDRTAELLALLDQVSGDQVSGDEAPGARASGDGAGAPERAERADD
ncbi:acyl carrier protein, partial [Kitasatospora sp. NPDC001574]